MRWCSDPSYNARFGFVEFTDIPMAHTACMLNGLMLAERSLRVSMAKTGMSNDKATPGPPGGGMSGPTLGNMRQGLGGQMITNKPNNDPERVARTIHISGVDGQVTEQHLAQYFSVCGEVCAVRLSGDGRDAQRFAWVEFTTQESSQGSMSLDGQMLGTQQLRISASKCAIYVNGLLKFQSPAMGGDPPNTMPNMNHNMMGGGPGGGGMGMPPMGGMGMPGMGTSLSLSLHCCKDIQR